MPAKRRVTGRVEELSYRPMSDAKNVSLPAHLWAALDQMATEMGSTRDQLIAQGVFTLARLNGYLVPGKVHVASGGPPRIEPSPSAPPSARSGPRSAASASPVASRRPQYEEEQDEPPEDEEQDDLPQDDLPGDDEGMDDGPEEEDEPAPAPRGGRPQLTLFVAGRDAFKLTQDAMTIGRGKSCDMVIESNRVSREHARISREGNDFFFEDLNSSNGSFFGPQKEKVTTRRKIRDGDEFTLGTEKVKFSIRK